MKFLPCRSKLVFFCPANERERETSEEVLPKGLIFTANLAVFSRSSVCYYGEEREGEGEGRFVSGSEGGESMSLIGKRFRLPSNRVPPFLSLSVSFCRSISATCLWNECHRANLTLARIWRTFKWTDRVPLAFDRPLKPPPRHPVLSVRRKG